MSDLIDENGNLRAELFQERLRFVCKWRQAEGRHVGQSMGDVPLCECCPLGALLTEVSDDERIYPSAYRVARVLDLFGLMDDFGMFIRGYDGDLGDGPAYEIGKRFRVEFP